MGPKYLPPHLILCCFNSILWLLSTLHIINKLGQNTTFPVWSSVCTTMESRPMPYIFLPLFEIDDSRKARVFGSASLPTPPNLSDPLSNSGHIVIKWDAYWEKYLETPKDLSCFLCPGNMPYTNTMITKMQISETFVIMWKEKLLGRMLSPALLVSPNYRQKEGLWK